MPGALVVEVVEGRDDEERTWRVKEPHKVQIKAVTKAVTKVEARDPTKAPSLLAGSEDSA